MLPLDLAAQDRAWGIVVAGVGGTGVITIGQLLGMAAHLEGKAVVTQDSAGLAQKGGATWSHVQMAHRPEAIHTSKVDLAKADLVIGCDAIVTASKPTLAVMQQGRTFVAMNTHGTPTAGFVKNTEWQFPGGACEAAVRGSVGEAMLGAFDAEQAATQLLGDSIYTNPLMLGYVWQQGRLPLTHAALMRAIELNGVQVDLNKAAFEWGRRCAHDGAAVQALYAAHNVIQIVRKSPLADVVKMVHPKPAEAWPTPETTKNTDDIRPNSEKVQPNSFMNTGNMIGSSRCEKCELACASPTRAMMAASSRKGTGGSSVAVVMDASWT